jgi:hypothetical protein
MLQLIQQLKLLAARSKQDASHLNHHNGMKELK